MQVETCQALRLIQVTFFSEGEMLLHACDSAAAYSVQMPTVSAVIRQLRTDARLTPQGLAKAAGISRATVYRLENGEIADPDLQTIRGVAKALNVPLSEFFRQLEGQTATDTGTSDVRQNDRRAGPELPAAADESEFLDRMAWACLRAADNAQRHNAQSILEELAVSFTRAAHPDDPGAIEAARRDVRAARDRRRGGGKDGH